MLVMKCLPALRLLMTLPAFTPILSASFTRPACTDALILPSSFSVAASRDSRLAALAGQRGIAAADQPLARVSGVSDLGEVLVVEQRHLQRPAVAGQDGDGGGAQGGDPARARQRLQLADPHLGDRPAVADQDDLTEPEFISDDRDDFPERDRVGGIAREYPDRDRDPGPAGDHAELNLLAALLSVPGMPERAQRAAAAFQPRRRQIEQCQAAALKVACCQFLF